MARKSRATSDATPRSDAIASFREALTRGDDWFDALLGAISGWQAPEEEVAGRTYRYLIGGEAFDWLLLAERLCEDADGSIPSEEKEALLFFGRPPRELEDEEFREAIGPAKHRAHLNFLYGVTVEEALQLVVADEIAKERHSRIWELGDSLDDQVFERLYGHNQQEMLATFRESRSLPASDEILYSDQREFVYWLFKYRVSQSDPARVASDTRKALARVSELEEAGRRRAQLLAESLVAGTVVLDGEVVTTLG